MARDTILLDDNWQQIASGACIITVKTADNDGQLFLNDAAVDDNAMVRTRFNKLKILQPLLKVLVIGLLLMGRCNAYRAFKS